MPPRPKKHHYVTKAYLDGFLDEGSELLFCYGRHRAVPFRSRPSELAHERDYYSFREPDGTWNDSLEHEIEERVEGPGLAAMRELISGKARLDWDQRNALAMLMAVQRFRVPHLRRMIDTLHSELIRNLLIEFERMQKEQGEGAMWLRSVSPFRPDDKERRAYISREELQEMERKKQEDPDQFSRETLFTQAAKFAKIITRMKWTLNRSENAAPFITSDCPVLLRHDRTDVKYAGVIRPDAEIHFPLSRNTFLSMRHDLRLIEKLNGLRKTRRAQRILNRLPEIRLREASRKEVCEFNVLQAQYCSRWTFCGRENQELLDVLQGESRNVRQRFVSEGGQFRFESLIGEP